MTLHLVGIEGEPPYESYITSGTPIYTDGKKCFQGKQEISISEYCDLLFNGDFVFHLSYIVPVEKLSEVVAMTAADAPPAFNLGGIRDHDLSIRLFDNRDALQAQYDLIIESLIQEYLSVQTLYVRSLPYMALNTAFAIGVRNYKAHALIMACYVEHPHLEQKRSLARALLSKKDFALCLKCFESLCAAP